MWPYHQTPAQKRRHDAQVKPIEGIPAYNRLTARDGVIVAEAYGKTVAIVHKHWDHLGTIQIVPCLELSQDAARDFQRQLGELLP